jgi:tetratricopeptide (TPR) repeat protein
MDWGQRLRAEGFLREAKLLLQDHPEEQRSQIFVKRYLAELCWHTGQLQEGLDLYEELVKDPETNQLLEFPEKSILFYLFASLLMTMNEDRRSETLFREALRLEREHDPNGLRTALCDENLAILLMDRQQPGDLDEARVLIEEAFSIQKHAFAPKVRKVKRDFQTAALPALGATCNSWASILGCHGRLHTAIRLARFGLQLRRNTYNVLHGDVTESENTLARLYLQLGRLKEAESYAIRAKTAREDEQNRMNRASIGGSWMTLGSIRLAEHNLVDARRCFRQAVACFRASFKGPNRNVAYAVQYMARTLSQQRRKAQAKRLFHRALRIARQLGENHRLTREIESDLACLGSSGEGRPGGCG